MTFFMLVGLGVAIKIYLEAIGKEAIECPHCHKTVWIDKRKEEGIK